MNFATDTNGTQLVVYMKARVKIGRTMVPVQIMAIGAADVHGSATVIVRDPVVGSRINCLSKDIEVG